MIGLVVGFAAQRTLGNFIAGLLIAFAQPLRLGDEVEIGGDSGVVEEIGLTYTWLRTRNNDRLVIPNEKLASETIRNSSIRATKTMVEVTVQVPPTADLTAVVAALDEVAPGVQVTSLRGARRSRCAGGSSGAPISTRRRAPCGSPPTSGFVRWPSSRATRQNDPA